MSVKNEEFSDRSRAEDILLGALGFGEGAHLEKILKSNSSLKLLGSFADGEKFEVEYEDDLSQLELWALNVLEKDRVVEVR